MNGFAGTWALLRLAARRDRVVATAWVVGLGLLALSQAASIVELYPTQADLERLSRTLEGTLTNPAVVAMAGPPFDTDSYGGLVAWQLVVFQAALVGVMSVLLVTRHTRAEEERGRAELVSAAPVGRWARLAAALAWVLVVNVLLALVTVAGMLAYDLEPAGSVGMAVACGAAGMVFAATAAVAAQLTERARAANGIANAAVGVAFLLRAAGDAASEGSWMSSLKWLSPIGWAQQFRAYGGDRWWVLLLPLAATVLLLVVVAVLVRGRDVGAGLLPSRLGAAAAGARLRGPDALAWRLQRGSLIGWAVALIITGLSFGGIAADITSFAEVDPTTAEALAQLGGGGSLEDSYLAGMLWLIAIAVAAYAVQATLRLRSEETDDRAEPVLATAVPRARWMASHLLVALAGSALTLAAAGLGMGLAHGLRVGDLGQVPRLVGAALVQAPAVWLMAALAAALFGLLPRLIVGASWAAVALALVVGQFGDMLRLEQWVRDLSPFTHVPRLPAEDLTAMPLVWLTVLAVGLAGLGLAGFRRRDLG